MRNAFKRAPYTHILYQHHSDSCWKIIVVVWPIVVKRQRSPLPYGHCPGCHPRALPVATHKTHVTTQDKTKTVHWSVIPALCRCILYPYPAVSYIIVVLGRCIAYYWYPCYVMPLYRILLRSLLYYAAVSHIIVYYAAVSHIIVILCRCIAYYWLRERSSVLQGGLQFASLTGSLSTSCHPHYHVWCDPSPPDWWVRLSPASHWWLPPPQADPPHAPTPNSSVLVSSLSSQH